MRHQCNKCSICHKPKPIVKTLPGETITGSVLKRKPQVLICADCDAANAQQYEISQKRHAQDMVKMIRELIIEFPDHTNFATQLQLWQEKAK